MSAYGYTLPPTAVCPGCGEIVVLPQDPPAADAPPLVCGSCESEVPDQRRAAGYTPPPPPLASAWRPRDLVAGDAPRAAETALEQRRFSRGGLFRSLGGLIVERGVVAVESAKERFTP